MPIKSYAEKTYFELALYHNRLVLAHYGLTLKVFYHFCKATQILEGLYRFLFERGLRFFTMGRLLSVTLRLSILFQVLAFLILDNGHINVLIKVLLEACLAAKRVSAIHVGLVDQHLVTWFLLETYLDRGVVFLINLFFNAFPNGGKRAALWHFIDR